MLGAEREKTRNAGRVVLAGGVRLNDATDISSQWICNIHHHLMTTTTPGEACCADNPDRTTASCAALVSILSYTGRRKENVIRVRQQGAAAVN